ncbi:MraY family glycosyltransferase [Lentibacillus sp. N15]|uniref:glycosyltransferase family 4 protein n=1 Tax=Lentibacillus songyuanensis TaxID=3136161 RepID=UPI0031BB3074
MFYFSDLSVAFLIALIATFLLTFPIKKLASKLGVMDLPNSRKIHRKAMPRMGGLAIFLGSFLGIIYLQPYGTYFTEIFIGAIIIVITGILDDKYQLRPVVKLIGQLIAAFSVISSGLIIERITIPIFGMIDLGPISVLVTILWIVGITNAINLIDGPDGLAAGVTTIAFISMLIMAIIDMRILAAYFCVVLIGANLGFLYHNFHPAKIYMGDTGSNFLGYMIAIVSILGLFKNLTLFGFIIPVILLAVPILDTLFAIARRIRNGQSIMLPDNQHIHYQLIEKGFSHRQTVGIIYGFSALFGVIAILLSNATITVAVIVIFLVLVLFHFLAELGGFVMNGKRPALDLVGRMFRKHGKG